MGQILYLLPVPHFFSQIDGVGGHVSHANGILGGFRGAGFRCDVISEPPSEGVLKVSDGRIIGCEVGPGVLPHRIRWSRKFLALVREQIRSTSYSAIYCRHSAGFSPWLPGLKRATGDLPLILEVNSLSIRHRHWIRYLEARGLRQASAIVCVSEDVRDAVVALCPDLADRAVTVPNGVDPDRFQPVAPQPPGPKAVVGYIGVFKPDYGIETLIEAFAAVRARWPEARLCLIGTGPHDAALRRMAEPTGCIDFPGTIPYDEVPAKMATFDVLVYTTTAKLSFQSPIKLYEYMAAERPIVAMRTRNTEVMLGAGEERGLLVDPDNADALATAILRVLNDAGLGRRMAAEARLAAETEHSWTERVSRILSRLSLSTNLSGLG